mgnify:CR=1 FL=1
MRGLRQATVVVEDRGLVVDRQHAAGTQGGFGEAQAAQPAVAATGSRWLVGLGILGALAAAMFGLLDLFAIPTGTRAFRTGLVHMALNLTVVALYAGSYLLRGGGGGEPDGVAVGLIALSVVALALLAVSGWLGGQLAYRYGVRVADEATQVGLARLSYTFSEGFEPLAADLVGIDPGTVSIDVCDGSVLLGRMVVAASVALPRSAAKMNAARMS